MVVTTWVQVASPRQTAANGLCGSMRKDGAGAREGVGRVWRAEARVEGAQGGSPSAGEGRSCLARFVSLRWWVGCLMGWPEQGVAFVRFRGRRGMVWSRWMWVMVG
jgi:hypothetical protein